MEQLDIEFTPGGVGDLQHDQRIPNDPVGGGNLRGTVIPCTGIAFRYDGISGEGIADILHPDGREFGLDGSDGAGVDLAFDGSRYGDLDGGRIDIVFHQFARYIDIRYLGIGIIAIQVDVRDIRPAQEEPILHGNTDLFGGAFIQVVQDVGEVGGRAIYGVAVIALAVVSVAE